MPPDEPGASGATIDTTNAAPSGAASDSGAAPAAVIPSVTDAATGAGVAVAGSTAASETQATPAAVTEGEAKPAAAVEHPAAETLLTDDKPGEAKPGETKQPTEAAPLQYAEFTLPEGLPEGSAMSPEVIGEFTGVIGPHRLPQDAAQSLLELHAREIQKVHAAEQAHQLDVFHDTVQRWGQEFLDDPEFKNQTTTVVQNGKDAIAQFGGSPQQQAELRWLMRTSGTGNHRAMLRFVNNMWTALQKYQSEGDTKAVGGDPGHARAGDPAARRYPSMG